MTEEDTYNHLCASQIIQSDHGGYYYFVPDYRVKAVNSLSNDTWGHILCSGKIYEIIKNKTVKGQLLTDWLSANWRQEKMMHTYIVMCDNYAKHITVTWPEPGGYWNWKE